MTEPKETCCSSPAAIYYWFAASLVAWGALSLIGVYWHPLHALSATTILFAMAIGCVANWLRHRTLHCAITGPLFSIAAVVFLLSDARMVHISGLLVWPFVLIGVGVAFLLEWRYAKVVRQAPKEGNSHPMNTEAIGGAAKPASKGTLAAAISAVGSVLAAAACCLPVLPFVLAAGTAGSARFLSSFIGTLRPYLLGFSVLLVALGFYQSRRASQCNCKPSVLSHVVLWLSALIVAISILLPQAFADLIERLL